VTAPRRALVVVDVQHEYFDGPLQVEHPPREESLARVVEAVRTAGAHGVPVVVVQHEVAADSPVFAAGSPGFALHPDLEAVLPASAQRMTKTMGSVFAGTGLAHRLREQGVDTVTLTGYMTNNCVLASAVEAEGLGLAAEVLSDATGAVHLSNEAGDVGADVVHTTLMVLLQSNWAAVATTAAWSDAVAAGTGLTGGDLVSSAVQGRTRAS